MKQIINIERMSLKELLDLKEIAEKAMWNEQLKKEAESVKNYIEKILENKQLDLDFSIWLTD